MDTRAIMQGLNDMPLAMHQPALDAAMAQFAATGRPPEWDAASREARPQGAIGVIPIQGPLSQKGSSSIFDALFGGSMGMEQIGAVVREFAANEAIGTIVLDINSPGGTVAGTPELAAEVFKARASKPVIAVANAHANSAAFWVGSQASEFIVTPSGLVGSIGVIGVHEDLTAMAEQMGVKPTVFTTAKFKAAGHPLEPLTDETTKLLQSQLDGFHDMFVKDVARGRGVKVSEVRGGFGEGAVVGAKEAVSLGMADRVGTLQETVARLAGGGRRAGARAEGEGVSLYAYDCKSHPSREVLIKTGEAPSETLCGYPEEDGTFCEAKAKVRGPIVTGSVPDADLDLRERRARLAGRA